MAHLIYSKSTQANNDRYSYKLLEVLLALFVTALVLASFVINTIALIQIEWADLTPRDFDAVILKNWLF